MKGRIWFILLMATGIAGCHRDQSETIDTSILSAPTAPQSEQSSPTTPPSDVPAPAISESPGPVAASAANSPITYQLPPGWSQQPGTDVRFATLTAADRTQIAITVFPGDVGGELANINRWRRQMDLPALTQDKLNQSITTIPTPAGQAFLADLSNHDQRMLAAMLPTENQTWFFKMTGAAAPIGRHAPEFMAILRSVRNNTLAAEAARP